MYCKFQSSICSLTIYRIDDPTGQYELDVCCNHMELLPANKLQIKENTETSPTISNFYSIGFQQFEIFLRSHETSSKELFLSVGLLRLTLEFPSVFQTMFQPTRRPNGKLKRIKCGMNCENVRIRLHQKETNILIYAYSHLFGGLDNGYRKWQALLHEGFTTLWEKKQVSEDFKDQYIQQYRQYRASLKANYSQQQLRKLLELEREMSLSLIMSLRRRASGWTFEEIISANLGDTRIIHYNGDPSDPHIRQDHAMSSYLASKKPAYDDGYAVLREIQLYSRKIENLRIDVFAGSRIGENILCASLSAERAKFSTALLLCRNPEYPHGSIGATDDICEPLFPWFQCDVGMSNFNISLHTGDETFPSVFLETQHGCYSHDIDKWQGNIDFSCESTGAMALRIECRDTVFNGCMNSEIFYTLRVLNDIWFSVFPLPILSLKDYFPQDCFHVETSFANEALSTSYVPPLEPSEKFLTLRNFVLASMFHFSNVVILFPDVESLQKVTTLESESNIPASFALRYDLSVRVLSGHQKEEWSISLYRVDFSVLPCMYLPLRSRVFGHYQWVDNQTESAISPLLVVEKIEAKYQIRIDDRSLQDRTNRDIQRIIHQTWGNFKSRLSIKINKISLLEYTNGRIISTVATPTLDIRIKRLENDQKLTPTIHLSSSSRNTRFPNFYDKAQFLLDDSWSYSSDITSRQFPPYLVEILLIDDSSKDRKLVAWCQIAMNSESWKPSITYCLTESDTRVEIGQIR